MVKLCPSCNSECEIRYGLCSECGEQFFEEKKKRLSDENGWGEDDGDDECGESEWDQFYKYEGG